MSLLRQIMHITFIYTLFTYAHCKYLRWQSWRPVFPINHRQTKRHIWRGRIVRQTVIVKSALRTYCLRWHPNITLVALRSPALWQASWYGHTGRFAILCSQSCLLAWNSHVECLSPSAHPSIHCPIPNEIVTQHVPQHNNKLDHEMILRLWLNGKLFIKDR